MRIDIRVFDNHINHNYPSGHWAQVEWERIKKEILVAENTSTNIAHDGSESSSQICPCCNDVPCPACGGSGKLHHS